MGARFAARDPDSGEGAGPAASLSPSKDQVGSQQSCLDPQTQSTTHMSRPARGTVRPWLGAGWDPLTSGRDQDRLINGGLGALGLSQVHA